MYTGPAILQSDQQLITAGDTGVSTLLGVSAGSRLIAIETSSSSDVQSVNTITDSQGNTWTKQETATLTGRTTAIWCAVASASGTCTITATYSFASNWVLTCFETDPADVAASDSESFSGSTTEHDCSAAGISGDANTLIIAACSLNALTSSWTAGSNYSLAYSSLSSSHATAIQTGEFETPPATERGTFTTGTPRAHSSAMITLVEPPTTPSTTTGFRTRKSQPQATGFRK